MSVSTLIASDYPLPLIDRMIWKTITVSDTDIKYPSGFMVASRSYLRGYDETDHYIQKKYKYDISWDVSLSCFTMLQEYLLKNMKSESDIEIWKIWLGEGHKDYYKTKTPVKHAPAEEKENMEDEIDFYKESI